MNFDRCLGVLFCVTLLFAAERDTVRAEEAADAFDCAACHPLKIRDFKGRRTDPVTPVEEYPELETGVQDIASSPAMCFSCHDGFVADSRDIWAGGQNHGHRIGMPPPADMMLPEFEGLPEFPLNDDGNLYCGTCHSAHINESDGAFARVRPFMRQSADGGGICTACHVEKEEIKGSVHDKGRRRALDFEARGACGACHAPHGSNRPLMWARDFGDAELPLNRLCRSCHDDGPDPGEHPTGVIGWSQDMRSVFFANTAAEMPVFDDNGRQARVGHIACATCHDVHVERAPGLPAEFPGLHLRMPDFVEPLCADCHGTQSLFLYKFFHSSASRQ